MTEIPEEIREAMREAMRDAGTGGNGDDKASSNGEGKANSHGDGSDSDSDSKANGEASSNGDGNGKADGEAAGEEAPGPETGSSGEEATQSPHASADGSSNGDDKASSNGEGSEPGDSYFTRLKVHQALHQGYEQRCDVCYGFREEARQRYEGLVNDGSGFSETLLADAPDLPPARYFPVGAEEEIKLVRPGDMIWLHGENGAGKSPTVVLAGAEALALDPDCLWILMDYELGQIRQRERLLEAGFSREQIEESIFYVEFPPLLTNSGKDRLVEGVLNKAERYQKVPRLMTWDTYSRSCSQLPNSDPEKNSFINNWFTSHPDWAKTEFERHTGQLLTQWIPDHPNVGDSPRPGGGHAKQDRVTINLWLRKGESFDKDHEGGYSTYQVSKHAHGTYVGQDVAKLRNRLIGNGVSRFYTEGLIGGQNQNNDDEVHINFVSGSTRKSKLQWEMEIQTKLRDAGAKGTSQSKVVGGGNGQKPRLAALGRLFEKRRAARVVRPNGVTWWDIGFAPAGAETGPLR